MMGSPGDFRALLRACETQTWAPVVDSTRPLAEIADAFRREEASEQFGKLGLLTVDPRRTRA